MNEEKLIKYYNKFNEDKRLTTKHGMIEFKTSMKYILEYLNKMDNPKIIDIGAGTGKYSLALDKLGYDVSAIELVKHNLKVLESKNSNVKTYLGNAIDLSKFKDNSFDLVILFGPMYHLINIEDKIKALNEAKRIVKKSGYIL
jgi:ubiquinone/menaquinone biosynthesis C-methylase UbiE